MTKLRRRGRAVLLAGLLGGLPTVAAADGVAAGAGAVPLTVCFNWSCRDQVRVALVERDWRTAESLLAEAQSPAHERELLAVAVGRLYAALAQRTPVAADRAGNTADAGADGRMDCIDHAETTSQLLRGLEVRGALRFHRVTAVQRRTRFVVAQHLAAAVEERQRPLLASAGGALVTVPTNVYVVDSWFADPGTPAVILPLAAWMEGDGPNVD